MKVHGLNQVWKAHRLASGSPAPSSTAVEVDSVSLSGSPPATPVAARSGPTSRPLYQEAQQLGILSTSAAVPGPLGAVLSEVARRDLGQLIEDLQEGGVSFFISWNPGEYHRDKQSPLEAEQVSERILDSEIEQNSYRYDGRFKALVAHAEGMEAVPIAELADLRDLEAIQLRKDVSLTAQPELAQKLMRLEEMGFKARATSNEESDPGKVAGRRHSGYCKKRDIGAFGAYRGLRAEQPADSKYLWTLKEGSDAIRLQAPEDLQALSYFAFAEPGWEEADELAQKIRDLHQQGYTFALQGHAYDTLDPLTVWNRFGERESSEFMVGVRGYGAERAKLAQIQNPDLLDPKVLALGEFYQNRLLPLGAPQEESDLTVRILAFGPAEESLEVRYQGLQRLKGLVAELEPQLDSQKNLGYAGGALRDLLKTRHPDESLGELIDDYSVVRRRVPHSVSVETLSYLRDRLPARTVDAQDRAEQCEQILQIASFASSFKPVEMAHELLTADWVDEAFPERLEVFRGLTAAAGELPEEKVDMLETRAPMAQACEDYRLLLRHRGRDESLAGAAEHLKETHKVLVPRLGWQPSREAFARFQKLHSRRPELTLESYLGSLQRILEASPEGETSNDYDAVLRFRRSDEDLETTSERLSEFHQRLGRAGWEQSREIFASFQRGDEPDHSGFLADQDALMARLESPFPEGHPDLAKDYTATAHYRLPGQSHAQAVEVLAQLQTALKGDASTEQGRKLYLRLIDEFQKGVFEERELQEVLDDFLENYAQHLDRYKAYALTRFPSVDENEFKFEEDAVVIGDFELELDF